MRPNYWRRNTVPNFPVEYNPAGILTASAGLMLPTFGPVNFSSLVTTMPDFAGSGCVPIMTDFGPSMSANGGYVSKSGSPMTGTGPMTFACIFSTTNTATASNNNVICYFGDNGIAQLWQTNVENGVIWGRFYDETVNGGSGYNDGKHHTLVMTKASGANASGVLAYVDGKPIALTVGGASTNVLNIGGSGSGRSLSIFYDTAATTGQFIGDVPLFVWDESVWTADQAAYFNDEPFSLFRPLQRRVYSIVTSGTAITVNDIGFGLTEVNASISTNNSLAVVDIGFDLSEDNVNYHFNLSPADLGFEIAEDNSSLLVNYALSINGLSFGLIEDNVNYHFNLSPSDLGFGLSEDNITFVSSGALSVTGIAFGLSESNVTPSIRYSLAVSDAAFGLIEGSPSISIRLLPANLSFSESYDSLTITAKSGLSVAGMSFESVFQNSSLLSKATLVTVNVDFGQVFGQGKIGIILGAANLDFDLSEDNVVIPNVAYGLVPNNLGFDLSLGIGTYTIFSKLGWLDGIIRITPALSADCTVRSALDTTIRLVSSLRAKTFIEKDNP